MNEKKVYLNEIKVIGNILIKWYKCDSFVENKHTVSFHSCLLWVGTL